MSQSNSITCLSQFFFILLLVPPKPVYPEILLPFLGLLSLCVIVLIGDTLVDDEMSSDRTQGIYAARLHSGACKHYNVRSVLHGIFWYTHSASCMNGAAWYERCCVGDSRTTYHINRSRTRVPYRLCGPRSDSTQL